jgi:hypothetical protein
MPSVQPTILIGIGYRAQRTVRNYVHRVQTEWGDIPTILPIIVEFSSQTSAPQPRTDGIQVMTLFPPEFGENEWPAWLPTELIDLPPGQREHTRAWMRAALLQKVDDLHEFLVERIPGLSSLETLEKVKTMGLSLTGNQVDIYVIADLNDHLGGGAFLDVNYLIAYVCQQLSLTPWTTGLLYLPSAMSPAPAEEAIAYAALKELEHYASGHRYVDELMPDPMSDRQHKPFEAGCYLLDTVNELGYTLQDESQQVASVSEWLYAMTFLNMAAPLRQRREKRYQTATLRAKSRIYESFGLAIRYMPQKPLIDWTAAQLGKDIVDRLIHAPPRADVKNRTQAFMDRVALSVDALRGRLGCANGLDGVPNLLGCIEKSLQTLRHTNLGQIELSTRQVLNAIRETHLPALQSHIGRTVPQFRAEIRRAVNTEIVTALEDMPVQGIATAHCFLDLLRDQVSEQQKQVEERYKRHRTELRRWLATVSGAHYALRSVKMGIPPWPIVLLGIVATLLLPLAYEFQLITRIIRPLSETRGLLSLGILIAGTLAVLGFIALRLIRQRRIIAEQHVRMVRERLDIESAPLIDRAMRDIYEATQEAIAQAKADVDNLIAGLRITATYLENAQTQGARTLEQLTSPGLFRSLISLDQAKTFYRRATPALDSQIAEWAQQVGPPTSWRGKCAQSAQPFAPWLEEQLLRFGRRYMEWHVQEVDVSDLISETEFRQTLERMFDNAQPLWNDDPRLLRRAKTQRLTFVGISGDRWPFPTLGQARPAPILVDTEDPYCLIVLNIHRGLPLFALRRLREYRTHYAQMLLHSRLPPHTTRELALANDLFPVCPRDQLSTASLFAAGLALGIIGRDPDGRYLAPQDRAHTIRLSETKVRAAALLGMDGMACREIVRQLDFLVTSKSAEALRSVLEEYVATTPDIEDWQVRGILEFERSHGLTNVGATL